MRPAAYTRGVLAMERTHALRADLDWMPRRARVPSRLIRGAGWTVIGATAAGAAIFVPGAAALLWKGLVVGGAGAAALADGAARAVMRKQIAKMTRGELPLAELEGRDEGELVVVRGTIEAEDAVRGLLIDAAGVYRRMVFKSRGTWVHEAAVDFTLVDEHGGRIRIQAAGARWMTPRRELVLYPGARLARPEVPVQIRSLAAGRESIEAIERVLPIGATVQIVGYKTTTADPTGTARDYRLPPQRATLQSGPELPLVISIIDE